MKVDCHVGSPITLCFGSYAIGAPCKSLVRLPGRKRPCSKNNLGALDVVIAVTITNGASEQRTIDSNSKYFICALILMQKLSDIDAN